MSHIPSNNFSALPPVQSQHLYVYIIGKFSQNNCYMKKSKRNCIYKQMWKKIQLPPQKSHNDRFFSLVPHLVKKFQVLYGPEGSLPCSQQHKICPYHEPQKSIPGPPIIRLLRPCNIFQFSLALSSLFICRQQGHGLLYHLISSSSCLLSPYSFLLLCFDLLWFTEKKSG